MPCIKKAAKSYYMKTKSEFTISQLAGIQAFWEVQSRKGNKQAPAKLSEIKKEFAKHGIHNVKMSVK